MDARVPPEGVPQVADHGGARLERQQVPKHRLPGGVLLQRAQGYGEEEVAGRGRPRAAEDFRQARHPPRRAEASDQRRGRRRV